MLLAARESAVTKKPRLRLTIRRSSSVSPFGSFHKAMSRVMLTSCGIQWLAQVAKYFSHAHLYLKGTSWFTSVWPLMMRLSSARMRRGVPVCMIAATAAGVCKGAGVTGACATDSCSDGLRAKLFGDVGLTSSSQVNIDDSNQRIMRAAK